MHITVCSKLDSRNEKITCSGKSDIELESKVCSFVQAIIKVLLFKKFLPTNSKSKKKLDNFKKIFLETFQITALKANQLNKKIFSPLN